MIIDAVFTEVDHTLEANFGIVAVEKGLEDAYKEGFADGTEYGKNSMVDESKIIEATAEGIGYVDIYDVSEFPHDVTIQIPHHNLCDTNALRTKSTWIEDSEHNIMQSGMVYTQIPVNPSKTYIISVFDYETVLDADYIYKISNPTIITSIADVWSNSIYTISKNNPVSKPIQFTSGYITLCIRHRSYDDVTKLPLTQIEEGTEATDYVPYVDLTELKVKQFNTNLCCDFKNRTVKDVPYQNETLRQWDGKSIVLGLGYANGTYENGIKDFSIDEENDSITFTATSTAYGVAVDMPCIPNEPMAVAWESSASFRAIYLCYDDVGNVIYKNVAIISKGANFTPPENAKWFVLSFAPTDAYINTPITIKNIKSYFSKLESNSCTLPYEPYIENEYAPNENGIIMGIKSVTPDMTFIPNYKCNLTVNYRKSWILDKWDKDMWSKIQHNGNRTSYYVAFNTTSGITDKFFNPIYTIKGNCDQAFAYSYLTDTKVPCIPTSAISMFNGATRLKTIRSLDISAITGTLTSTFNNCTSLENLTMVGTINASGFDVSTCTKLTHDSLMSIINALASGVSKVVTLGATNLAKLTDAEKSIATEKGWTLG